jgi:hypothetical protein
VIFAGRAFLVGWPDQPVGEQRHNALEHLFPGGLSAQDPARLLHFIALLTVAMPAALQEVALDLFPGWPGAI